MGVLGSLQIPRLGWGAAGESCGEAPLNAGDSMVHVEAGGWAGRQPGFCKLGFPLWNSPEICAVIRSGRDALENFLAKVPISTFTYLYEYLP